MITNLVFKRTTNVEGASRTEMKIIEVLIPELKSSEGWTLVSSADKVDQVKLQECRAIPPEVKAEQAEEDAAIAEFLKKYQAEKEEKLKMQLSMCSCSGKPDPNITAYNKCDVTYDQYTKPEVNAKVAELVVKHENSKEKATNSVDISVKTPKKLTEYPSPILGTACLIRRNDTIRIAYREGKKGNINTPNKVCIADVDKQRFFNAVRSANACTDIIISWSLDKRNHQYDIWNKFIDDEYIRQKSMYIKNSKEGEI